LLAFAAVCFIWGSTYLAIRFAIETIPPLFMAGVRFVVAGGILYVNPVVAVMLGWALADEPLSFRSIVAAVIIVGSVVIITTEDRRGE
jgi:drug/metabolite transporter (DMT)-like permease